MPCKENLHVNNRIVSVLVIGEKRPTKEDLVKDMLVFIRQYRYFSIYEKYI